MTADANTCQQLDAGVCVPVETGERDGHEHWPPRLIAPRAAFLVAREIQPQSKVVHAENINESFALQQQHGSTHSISHSPLMAHSVVTRGTNTLQACT